ncbi:MAG: hypothetical protein IV093_17010 [Rubrivivax sp.]|nr:hypothetical protein [Rubrivivax sp.]
MSWGGTLQAAFQAVVSTGRDAASILVSAVDSSMQAAADAARAAATIAVAAGQQAYSAGAEAVMRIADFTVDTAHRGRAVSKGIVATAIGTAGALGSVAVAIPAIAAAGIYNDAKSYFSDKQPALQPLTSCSSVQGESADARKERILKRQTLISQGKKNPASREAAERLERDMHSVELARLSANVYTQYNPNDTDPQPLPQPWKAASPDELKKLGYDPDTAKAARSTVYILPPDFPYEPKQVVAFQGTTGDPEDILTNHDNALGRSTAQYTAAMAMGEAMANMTPPPMVTGHSLGGGKAQAAVVGAGGNVRGQMFNSAGVHPDVVGSTPEELASFGSLCNQQRTTGGLSVGGGDPLTGLQMSPSAQKLAFGTASVLGVVTGSAREGMQALGVKVGDVGAAEDDKDAGVMGALGRRLSSITADEAAANHKKYGWYVPPTLGQNETQTLVSKNSDGTETGLAAQHSIVNMVNGYESRKINDVQALAKATGSHVPLQDLIGPAP